MIGGHQPSTINYVGSPYLHPPSLSLSLSHTHTRWFCSRCFEPDHTTPHKPVSAGRGPEPDQSQFFPLLPYGVPRTILPYSVLSLSLSRLSSIFISGIYGVLRTETRAAALHPGQSCIQAEKRKTKKNQGGGVGPAKGYNY